MKPFLAFFKKEWIENIRGGKIPFLIILFLLFGIMNPAIAKLTPWLMKTMADSLAETGITVTQIQVTALMSWTQFFKNIPMGLIAFVLIFYNSFTKEYQSGTLVLVLTKGLDRSKVVLAKLLIMLAMWTACYSMCFAVTYGYNSYYWDNSIVTNLFNAALYWWLFGVFVICLIVFFSTILSSGSSVLFCTASSVLAAYVAGMFPKIKNFSPALLMNSSNLLSGNVETGSYTSAIIVTIALFTIFIATSIIAMNKKQIV